MRVNLEYLFEYKTYQKKDTGKLQNRHKKKSFSFFNTEFVMYHTSI